ncbi:MAG: phenol hydroxylase subunit [Pseudomonadota bacterium]
MFTPTPAPPPSAHSPAVDITRRFVRITAQRGPFVEFDFAIGWPELSVELVLPRAAFDEFCQRNAVTFLTTSPELPTPTPDDEET